VSMETAGRLPVPMIVSSEADLKSIWDFMALHSTMYRGCDSLSSLEVINDLNFFQEKSTSRLRVWTADFASCSEFRDWSSILLDCKNCGVV